MNIAASTARLLPGRALAARAGYCTATGDPHALLWHERPLAPIWIELRDADPGETLWLMNYMQQPANDAYRASHAIFVREGAEAT